MTQNFITEQTYIISYCIIYVHVDCLCVVELVGNWLSWIFFHFSGSSMVQSALTSHQNWVVAVQWSPNREHQLLSGSYNSSLKFVSYHFSVMFLLNKNCSECGMFEVVDFLCSLSLGMRGKVLCLDWSLPQVGNRLFIQALCFCMDIVVCHMFVLQLLASGGTDNMLRIFNYIFECMHYDYMYAQ